MTIEKEIVEAAKKRFDKELHSSEYKRIHSDDYQLNKLIDMVDIQPRKKYLDIGTGNGYVAFSLAKKFPDVFVNGLDIALNAINENNKIIENEKLKNIEFNAYDGIILPYKKKSFYGVISRYAFHHFPDIEKSVSEITRVTDDNGFFILSDPQTYDDDLDGFADKFQSQVNDGHVHFYTRKEIESIFKNHNFLIEKEFNSAVRYPRVMNNKYEELFKNTNSEILNKYRIEFEQDKVFISVSVMNILIRKTNN